MRAVFDASVLLRGVVDDDPTADAWLRGAISGEISVSVPDLVYAEVANALLQYVRHAPLTLHGADRILQFVRELPFDVHELRALAAAALAYASTHGLSVYDSVYAVLADAQGGVLVTADRRLAAAASAAELLS